MSALLVVANGQPPSWFLTILRWEGSTCQKEELAFVVVGRPRHASCALVVLLSFNIRREMKQMEIGEYGLMNELA